MANIAKILLRVYKGDTGNYIDLNNTDENFMLEEGWTPPALQGGVIIADDEVRTGVSQRRHNLTTLGWRIQEASHPVRH